MEYILCCVCLWMLLCAWCSNEVQMYVLVFFSSFAVSVVSSSDVLYGSRKCKICQTVSLFLFCMGAKFHELLLAQGKNKKIESV